jgi:hypothetical protein
MSRSIPGVAVISVRERTDWLFDTVYVPGLPVPVFMREALARGEPTPSISVGAGAST